MTLTDITLTAPGDAPSLPDGFAPLPSLDAFWARLEAECDAVPQDTTQSEAAHESHRNNPANSPYVYPLQRFTGAEGEKVRWRSLGALGRRAAFWWMTKCRRGYWIFARGKQCLLMARRHGVDSGTQRGFEDEGGIYASGDLQIETKPARAPARAQRRWGASPNCTTPHCDLRDYSKAYTLTLPDVISEREARVLSLDS